MPGSRVARGDGFDHCRRRLQRATSDSPSGIETAGYLLVAGVVDAAAARSATHVAVTVTRTADDLHIEMSHDGTDLRADLMHVTDRVGAVGGRSRRRRPDHRRAAMRVVVADDVMLTRTGIARLLGDAGMQVVGEAADAESLLREVASKNPDIAVIDIRMPPTHTDEGLVAAKEIRAKHPGRRRARPVAVRRAGLRHAAIEDHPERCGYLLKERVFDVAILVDALRRIDDGDTVIDPTIVSRLVGRRHRQGPLAALTPREQEVLAMVAEGLSNRAIADRIHLSERTVEAHVTQIFLKLKLPDTPDRHRRVQAVVTYLRSSGSTSGTAS